MSSRRKRTSVPQELNLLDTPRTWFLWNENEQNVKEALPEIFDAWIRQYVDTIVKVDTSVWEIFHRWGIINACLAGKFLTLREREDGSLLVEEKASEPEADVEAERRAISASEAN